MELNQLSSEIIKAGINVHKALGPGLLESVYQSAMTVELEYMGLAVQSEAALPVFYRGQKIHDEGFRLDLLVEETVIVELKSVAKLENIHKEATVDIFAFGKKAIGIIDEFQRSSAERRYRQGYQQP